APDAAALAPLEPAQQRFFGRRLTQRAIDRMSGVLGTAHRQIHARGEHRIDEGERVSDQHPAWPTDLPRIVGIVAGDVYLVADELGVLEAPPECRIALQRRAQELDRATATLLEVIRTADRADAHHACRQRNHPHPAMLEAIDADVARVIARA